jgi:hypothetical protein
MNRKGITPLFAIIYVIMILLSVYLFLFLPVPAFKTVRMTINYFLILIFWVIIQVLIIYAYYKLIRFCIVNVVKLRHKIHDWTFKVKRYVIVHR